MKNIIVIIASAILLSACAPSQEVIQQAIEQTQAAIPTETPIPTIAPTMTQLPYVKTPRDGFTPTSNPEPNYYVEYGFCVMSVTYISGNPGDIPGCGVVERKQVSMQSNQEIEVEFTRDITDRQNYCALFKLDGTFIMADVDTNASGKVVCYP